MALFPLVQWHAPAKGAALFNLAAKLRRAMIQIKVPPRHALLRGFLERCGALA
jgi:hypothetical protein